MAEIVGIDIAFSSSKVYVWFDDGTVRRGSSVRSDDVPYKYTLPAGKQPNDIVDIAIASDDHCYAWYRDGTVSSGTSDNLAKYRSPYSYKVASGKTPNDIVGIAISQSPAFKDLCHVYYRDGTKYHGSSDKLGASNTKKDYSLAPGMTPNDVVSIGIAPDKKVYAWYQDGTVSAGSSDDLDKFLAPYNYDYFNLLLTGKEIEDILRRDIRDGIAGSCKFYSPDDMYRCPSQSEVQSVINSYRTQNFRYISEVFDCDDFALLLKSEFVKNSYQNGSRKFPSAAGILWGSKLVEGSHAINFYISPEKETYFIEPQNGEVYMPRKKDYGIWWMYY
jgi:hypothetical protein